MPTIEVPKKRKFLFFPSIGKRSSVLTPRKHTEPSSISSTGGKANRHGVDKKGTKLKFEAFVETTELKSEIQKLVKLNENSGKAKFDELSALKHLTTYLPTHPPTHLPTHHRNTLRASRLTNILRKREELRGAAFAKDLRAAVRELSR